MNFATRQLTAQPASARAPGALARANAQVQHKALQDLHDELVCSLSSHGAVLQALQRGASSGVCQSFEHARDFISAQFVVPGVLPQAMPLLHQAIAGPRDPFVCLQQQHGAGHKPRSVDRRYMVHMLQEGARAYVQLARPDEAQHLQAQIQQQLQQRDRTGADEGATSPDQVCHQQVGVSDAAALMLVAPVPAECLQGPQGWWAWHQQLMGLDKCDVCDKQAQQVGYIRAV